MKKAMTVVMHNVVLIVIAAIIILSLAIIGGGVLDTGSKQTDSASSGAISLSERTTQCNTFCGGKIGSADDANSRCATLTCNGKTYGFTCVYSLTASPPGKCAEACKGASYIPDSCKGLCIDTLPYQDCPTYRLNSFLGGSCLPMTPAANGECISGYDACEGCNAVAPKICCRSSGGPGPGPGPGPSGDIVLKQIIPPSTSMVAVSTIRPGIKTYVEIVIDSVPQAPTSIEVRLLKSDGVTEASCGVPSSTSGCVSIIDNDEFVVPAKALKDGSYRVEIKAKKGPEEKTRMVSLSWYCPQIKFEPTSTSKWGPTVALAAIFESDVLDLSKVLVKINTREYPSSSLAVDTNDKRKVLFTLPKIGAPYPEPSLRTSPPNELVVGRYDAGICIKTETTLEGTTDYVKNEIRKTFTWSCPSSGCTTTGGKQYIVSGVQDSGGYTDPATGCSYSTLGAECTTGCEKGACKEAKLKINSVKLDDVVIGTVKIYENFANDRIIKVAVENTGTLTAEDVDDVSRTTTKLDSAALGMMAGPTDIAPQQSGIYEFQLSKGVPSVPLGKMSVIKTLYLTAQGSNTESVSKTQPVTFYKCGSGCKTYNTQPLCNACFDSYGCLWNMETAKCDYKCHVTSNGCTTFSTKEDCDACEPCKWNPSDPTPCSIDPFYSIP